MQQDRESKSDEELVILSLQSQVSFTTLIKRYQGRLLGYVMKLSDVSREDAEDIFQDAFIKIYRNLNGFDQKMKFSTWAYRIVHNEVISAFRKRRVRAHGNAVGIDEAMMNKLVSGLDTSRKVDLSILKDQVNEVFQGLPIKYRDVLILKFIEQKDYKEISDILQKPIGTVGTLINRAKKKFKQEVERLQIDFKLYV